MNANTQHLLTSPLDQLPFSKDFICTASTMGFQTLGNILATDDRSLIKKTGFSYLWFAEIVDFLHERELFYLLEGDECF